MVTPYRKLIVVFDNFRILRDEEALVIDRGFCATPGFFLQLQNLDGFLGITENWYFLAGNLAHKVAESAILTGDVFPACFHYQTG
jgi:hypothetical protein